MASAEPKPGNLIEISHPGHQHWALYVGDGYVVHLGPPGDITGAASANIMSSGSESVIVKKELLKKVARKDKYRVNNKHDRKYSLLPPSKIVRRTEELVEQRRLYKISRDNCEHFVNEVRYGVHHCDQVTRAVCGAIVGVGLVVTMPAVLSAVLLGAGLVIKGVIDFQGS